MRERSDCGDLDSAIALSPLFFRPANPFSVSWNGKEQTEKKKEDHMESAPQPAGRTVQPENRLFAEQSSIQSVCF